MEPEENLYQLDQYRLKVQRIDNQLLLEAKSEELNITLSRFLDDEMIKSLSEKIIPDCKAFETIISTHFNSQDKKSTIVIMGNRRFSYTSVCILGSFEKEIKVEFDMDVVEELSLSALSEKIKELTQEIKALQVKLVQKDQHFINIEAKMDTFMSNISIKIEQNFLETQKKLDTILKFVEEKPRNEKKLDIKEEIKIEEEKIKESKKAEPSGNGNSFLNS